MARRRQLGSGALFVLKDCVTETKETSCLSNVSTSLAKSASERVRRSTLYDDHIHPALLHLGEAATSKTGQRACHEMTGVCAKRSSPSSHH